MSVHILAHYDVHHNRKSTLVALGQWAIATGRAWLVWAVEAAIQREGLTHG